MSVKSEMSLSNRRAWTSRYSKLSTGFGRIEDQKSRIRVLEAAAATEASIRAQCREA